MSEAPEKVCYACQRIDGKQFYREFRELGFASDAAAEIALWVRTVFEMRPALLSGRKVNNVKVVLASIGTRVYGTERRLDMRSITSFFGVSHQTGLTKSPVPARN